MLPLYERIEMFCQRKGVNITEMCRNAGIPRSALSDYKAGRKKSINLTNMGKMADYFGVSIDELTGRTQKENAPALTEKDERDIARKLDDMLNQLGGSDEALMFDGEPLDDETRELLRASLKNQLEMTKRMAKQKYTPKKYRG